MAEYSTGFATIGGPRGRRRLACSALVYGIGLVGVAWAGPSNEPVQLAQMGAPGSGEFFMAPFKYIAPRSTQSGSTAESPDAPKRPPQQQRIVDLSNAGEYATAASEGLVLQATEPTDDSLQLIIANSLAWSGRLRDATVAYQRITEEPLVDDANVGIANILRWKGHDEVAAPIYRDVLAKNPDHYDAKSGLEQAERELAPRTTVNMGRASDSSESIHHGASISHRWRDASGYRVYEIEMGSVRDELPTPIESRQTDVTLRYSDLGLALKPTLEISTPTNTNQTIYGGLKFSVDDEQWQFDVGRMNWGKYANNANALADGLSATHVGGIAKREYAFGIASARLDYYNISDDNTVWTSDVRLVSAWRPIGSHVKPFAGIETRSAKLATSRYWSPTNGYGSLYGGLMGDWSVDDWGLFAAVQMGLPLYGDAGTSWSLSGGARRWITPDVALSLNLWGMSSVRNGSDYRAQSANLILEKVWR